MPTPVLTLAPRQTHRCQAGHPWVFRSELLELPPLANGQEVLVNDHRNRLIGSGFYSEKSQIAIRLYSRQAEAFDATLLRRRLTAAIAQRELRMAGRPARRLVSSEGDLLPGLIVDQYGDRLVVQTTTFGMDLRQTEVVTFLHELLTPSQIIERNDLPVRELEGLPQRAGVLHGPSDARVTVAIGRLAVTVDLLDPHKTGAYLDQQLAHEELMRWVRPGDRLLDVCCHLGGFALHGLLAGAASAVGLDQSEASVRGAEIAAQAAGVSERFRTVHGDAFAWLTNCRDTFDVIVLDPPSFTRNRAGAAAALRGYRDLHMRALRRLAPGGRLLTYSCSHHVSREQFLETLVEAAADAHVTLRLDAITTQSPDHPVLPAAPETEYLKGFVVTVLA
jgi:23S rRNA (cytosine1962-C5)-methyltransferase